MKILVTGSNGFVGSHLIPKLEKQGHKITGMDIKDDFKQDIRNSERCLLDTINIDCVIHLAALADVQDSIMRPAIYNRTNVVGLLNLLRASDTNKVKRFIFASSAAADNPQSPYGVTKLCGEHWCDIFQKCYGLSTVSLRFFNIYGKGTDKGVIPIWIDAIKKGERPVIYGGNQTRDFVYVDDVVRAIICAMECDATGVYEVGTGIGTSMLDLCGTLFTIFDLEGYAVESKPSKDGEIRHSRAKRTEHTLDDLGFKAKYTLEQGLKEMLEC